jgi:hypothetical protein
MCSLECVRDSIVPAYCQSQITQNCFCRLGDVFESFSPCVENGCNVTAADALKITSEFYRDTCIYNPSANGQEGSEGAGLGDEIVQSPGQDSRVNKLDAIVGTLASFVGIVGAIIGFWVWIGRHVGHDRTLLQCSCF